MKKKPKEFKDQKILNDSLKYNRYLNPNVTVSPEEYLALHEERGGAHRRFEIKPPKLGSPGFGEFVLVKEYL